MKKLIFKDKFDCIICLDGDTKDFDVLKQFTDVFILAADGAAITLEKLKINYDKVIGDFDTLERNNFLDKIDDSKKIYIPEQESNDFDKCLNFALKNEYNNILIVGFHGGHFEHSLNNWSVLKRYSLTLNLCIYEEGRYAIPVSSSFEFTPVKEETISLIPQPQVRINTEGLKWNLKNEVLELGYREGSSNLAVSNNLKINIVEGSILFFINERLPFSPTFV